MDEQTNKQGGRTAREHNAFTDSVQLELKASDDCKATVYLSSRLNRILTQQALLDTWRAERTRRYMSTRAEQSVTFGVGADHAVLE